MLSTRGIVLPVYLIFFGYELRKQDRRHKLLLLVSMLLGLALTLLPFLIWDSTYFLEHGPFSVQLSHIPMWLLSLSLVAALLWGLLLKTSANVYPAIAITLFGIVLFKFLLSVTHCGIVETVIMDSCFDCAYFCFALPFLVFSMQMPGDFDAKTPLN